MRKGYVDYGTGQIHYRQWGKTTSPSARPLICLHPAPHSGAWFETMAPLLAEDRQVIAPDYPGYGRSDDPLAPPSIAEYGEAMYALVCALDLGSVHGLGFHTGCLVGAQMALAQPDQVRALVLIDIPFFTPIQRETLLAGVKPAALSDQLVSLEKTWTKMVSARPELSLQRRHDLFVEQLMGHKNADWGFRAAFSYEAEGVFTHLATPSLVIATKSALSAGTRLAADLIINASLIDRDDIHPPALETSADKLTSPIKDFLHAHDG